MTEKYYNKMRELKELKNIIIKNNQINSYNKEIAILKEKQKFIYNDFIINYNNQKDEINFKFENKIAQIKDYNKREIRTLKKRRLINNNDIKNKKILNLEKKLSVYLKLNLYEKIDEIKEEIKKEKNKLINIFNQKNKFNEKLQLNNLNQKQKRKMDKILMNFTKEKNHLEIKFKEEKYQLLNKFKNQINNFENYHQKNKRYEKINYFYYNNFNKNLNESFDAKILNKKLDDEESNISFNI